MAVKLYQKKPVIIQAMQYTKLRISDALDFYKDLKYNPEDNEYYIETLEGNMKVSEEDYIIKGVKGEFYPCKPDIFKETYCKVNWYSSYI